MSAEQRGFIHSVSTDLGCWFAVQWSATNLCTSGTPQHGLTGPPCNLWGHEPRRWGGGCHAATSLGRAHAENTRPGG